MVNRTSFRSVATSKKITFIAILRPGPKIPGRRESPRACVQVDEIESDLHWRSAIAFGKYEEITKSNEREEVLGSLLRQFPMLTPVESAIAVDASAPQVIVFRIRIDRLTGMSEG